MFLRYLSTALISFGILLIAAGIAAPRLYPTAFVSNELTEEYSEAATAFHSATIETRHGTKAASVEAARSRFEHVRDQVDAGRQRQKATGWVLSTSGFALLLVGALLRRSLKP